MMTICSRCILNGAMRPGLFIDMRIKRNYDDVNGRIPPLPPPPLTIIEAMTRAISSASLKRILHAPFDSSPEASSRRNQYKVSRASLRAMLYLLMKSRPALSGLCFLHVCSNRRP